MLLTKTTKYDIPVIPNSMTKMSIKSIKVKTEISNQRNTALFPVTGTPKMNIKKEILRMLILYS